MSPTSTNCLLTHRPTSVPPASSCAVGFAKRNAASAAMVFGAKKRSMRPPCCGLGALVSKVSVVANARNAASAGALSSGDAGSSNMRWPASRIGRYPVHRHRLPDSSSASCWRLGWVPLARWC